MAWRRDPRPYNRPMNAPTETALRPPAPERRAEAALELVIATNVGTRLSTTDWVARQKGQLSELRAHVRSLDSATGAWWFAGAAVTSR